MVQARLDARLPDRLEEPGRSESAHIPRVLRLFERDHDVALSAEVVDLVGLDGPDQAGELGPVGEVPVVQVQPNTWLVGIPVEVVDPTRVERRGPPDDPVNLVPVLQQEFR